MSSDNDIIIEDDDGYQLTTYANGTFIAYVGNCTLEIVGTIPQLSNPANQSSPVNQSTPITRRDLDVFKRQSGSALCDSLQFPCYNGLGAGIVAYGASVLCGALSVDLFADIGGGIGFLGNALGPEVGIPTTIAGVLIGEGVGTYVAGVVGQRLCGAVAGGLVLELCAQCPVPTQCGHGTALCNGRCIDILSDQNNCNECGISVSTCLLACATVA